MDSTALVSIDMLISNNYTCPNGLYSCASPDMYRQTASGISFLAILQNVGCNRYGACKRRVIFKRAPGRRGFATGRGSVSGIATHEVNIYQAHAERLFLHRVCYVAGTKNFYAITRYNWSSYYAMAVIELGREVAARVKP